MKIFVVRFVVIRDILLVIVPIVMIIVVFRNINVLMMSTHPSWMIWGQERCWVWFVLITVICRFSTTTTTSGTAAATTNGLESTTTTRIQWISIYAAVASAGLWSWLSRIYLLIVLFLFYCLLVFFYHRQKLEITVFPLRSFFKNKENPLRRVIHIIWILYLDSLERSEVLFVSLRSSFALISCSSSVQPSIVALTQTEDRVSEYSVLS